MASKLPRSKLGNVGERTQRRSLAALVCASVIGISTASYAAAHSPDWDQVENIKEAAQRLALIQRREGATKAFSFIDACYRTHSLSSNYTRAFEACIAQDYMETQVLALVYSRMSPAELGRVGAPTPQMLADSMQRRVGAAFAQYKVPPERISEFKKNVDEHGFPLFFQELFPDAKFPPSGARPAPSPASPDDPSPKSK